VQLCGDERTRDFTLALIDFVQWHDEQGRAPSITDLNGSPSSEETLRIGTGSQGSRTIDSETLRPSSPVSSHEQSVYEWPAFILNLLTDQKAWFTWRKKTERGATTSSTMSIANGPRRSNPTPLTKRRLYFDALCADRNQEIENYSLGRDSGIGT
jgi:hypothetical protein